MVRRTTAKVLNTFLENMERVFLSRIENNDITYYVKKEG